MTSNIFIIIAFGVGLKCPRKIHLNTQWAGVKLIDPPTPRSQIPTAIQFCRRGPRTADRNQSRKVKARALKKARSRPLYYCCTSTCRLLNAEGRTDDIPGIIMWNSQLESEIGYQHEGFKLSTDDLMVSEINLCKAKTMY